MPKFLYQVKYSPDGLRGLKKDTAAGRMAAAKAAVKGAGGKLESFYFTFGENDVICIVDLPDNATAAGMSVAIASTGLVTGSMTPLLTVEEVDKGMAKKSKYKGPGQ